MATVVAEPLERGFGLTLGNALRRVLLSSLQGAAITSVQIDGVLHEFSSIPGVREDVTDIVLNIKDIAIRMQGDGPEAHDAEEAGPGRGAPPATSASTGDIQVLNPELVICTLDEGAEIRMEFTVDDRQGLCARRPQPRRGCADRPHPDRQPLLAGEEGQLPRREHARRPGPRLRQADDDGRDQRRDEPGGCGRLTPRASCRISSTSS